MRGRNPYPDEDHRRLRKLSGTTDGKIRKSGDPNFNLVLCTYRIGRFVFLPAIRPENIDAFARLPIPEAMGPRGPQGSFRLLTQATFWVIGDGGIYLT